MMTWPLIALGGAVGAALRFVLDGEMKARGPRTWPHSTFAVNLLGSFVLGVLTAHPRPGWLSALVVTGVCGGFTTFSTASVETLTLLRERRAATALGYAVGSVVACVAVILLAHRIA